MACIAWGGLADTPTDVTGAAASAGYRGDTDVTDVTGGAKCCPR